MRQKLENPLILIHDKKISDMNLLVRILELAVKINAFFPHAGYSIYFVIIINFKIIWWLNLYIVALVISL